MSLPGEREHSAAEIVTALPDTHKVPLYCYHRPAEQTSGETPTSRPPCPEKPDTSWRSARSGPPWEGTGGCAYQPWGSWFGGTTLLGKFAGHRASHGGTTRTGARSDRSMDQCEYRPSTLSENDSERRLRGRCGRDGSVAPWRQATSARFSPPCIVDTTGHCFEDMNDGTRQAGGATPTSFDGGSMWFIWQW